MLCFFWRRIYKYQYKEFSFFLIGLNSIFSTLPQSEYTSRAVNTPRVRYIRACVYFCLLSIRCFNVVQPETRFTFPVGQSNCKKGQNFQKFLNFKKFKNFILRSGSYKGQNRPHLRCR